MSYLFATIVEFVMNLVGFNARPLTPPAVVVIPSRYISAITLVAFVAL